MSSITFPAVGLQQVVINFDDFWPIAENKSSRVSREEGQVLWHLAAENPAHVVEVGCRVGGTAWLLGTVADRLTMIDPWLTDNRAEAVENTAEWEHKRLVLSKHDYYVWPFWDGQISLMHLDHNHSYASTISSLRGWRPHMAGPVAVHDYEAPKFPDVACAVHDSGIMIEQVVETLAICRWN